MPSYALTDLSWTEVVARLARDKRLILPVGACDQYGPHLPLGSSTYIVEALASDLSREFGVLCAPTLPYGVNVPGEQGYAGAATLVPKTLHRVLNELLASWEGQGFMEFILLTAHGHDPHVEAIATVAAKKARVRVVETLETDLSQFLEGQQGTQHGGEVVTSLLLHLRPNCVNMEAAHDFALDPERFHRFRRGRLKTLPAGCRGSIGQPSLATAEKGALIYQHVLDKIRQKVFIAPPPDDPLD